MLFRSLGRLLESLDHEVRERAIEVMPCMFRTAKIAAEKKFAQVLTFQFSLWNEVERSIKRMSQEALTEEVRKVAIPVVEAATRCGDERVEGIARAVMRAFG